MNMVVRRNLYPAIPILAVLLGAGIAAVVGRRCAARAEAPRAVATAAVLAPASAWRQRAPSSRRSASPARAPATRRGSGSAPTSRRREDRQGVVHAELPARGVRRAAGPLRRQVHRRRAARRAERLLLLASAAYNRFQNPAAVTKAHQRDIGANYREIFSTLPLAREWHPRRRQLGPTLRLYRLDAQPSECTAGGTIDAELAFVPDGGMRPEPRRPVRYFADGQWSSFKACLEPGSYRVELDGTVAGAGELRLRAVAGRDIGRAALRAGQTTAGRSRCRAAKRYW